MKKAPLVYVCNPVEEPVEPGMTHKRDYRMEGDRPMVRSHADYAAEDRSTSNTISETGLVHRQPL